MNGKKYETDQSSVVCHLPSAICHVPCAIPPPRFTLSLDSHPTDSDQFRPNATNSD
jgi:hypothetical protein